MPRIPMTAKGVDLLREELEQLKKVERPTVIREVAEARSFGDLSENAEYHAAREKQGFIEGRIAALENQLNLVEIIDVRKIQNDGIVIFGATVTLLNLESEAEVVYQIVGEEEANLDKGQISISSPVARAIIGKKEGDTVIVHTPTGDTEYEIRTVEYL